MSDKENQMVKENDHLPEKKKKKIKVKCHYCNTKLGMIVFECKCGHKFCSAHLNAHSHNCTFDYVKEKKEQIKKNNPKVGEKFQPLL